MITQFITAEIKLEGSPAEVRQAIEAKLQTYGDPLRWAVTEVNITTQKAIVEAIITKKDEG
ncbi:hypothetical protein H6F86_15080 [Phormidium sp. FACHB-592]|uniref:Uncharacterized protein n=1 Tax=Stenomitos frigidus AS-A4 TaxID=2933935 RepID=A0ABV0KS30_9CYAN|nr:hypothetical protein [Phormidium sp. FACHB-592]